VKQIETINFGPAVKLIVIRSNTGLKDDGEGAHPKASKLTVFGQFVTPIVTREIKKAYGLT
jgi:hypothetical protein